MKKLHRMLAWVTALCLLFGCMASASAGTVYIWVGVKSFDLQETGDSNTGTTMTNVTVRLNGKVLSDGMCVDGSETVTFDVTDSVATTYTYQFSADGATYAAFGAGDTLNAHLPASAGTLYTVYFRVTGANAASNVTTASYTVYYDSLGGGTITGVTAKANGAALADGMWINGSEAITFDVDDSVATAYAYEVSTDGVNFSDFPEGSALALGNSQIFSTVYFRAVGANNPVDNVKTVSYALYFDGESPVLLCKAGTDGRLTFYAGDNFSGFVTDGSEKNVSFDGGATWSASLSYYGQNVYTCSVRYGGAGTIPAGTLAVRDRAGNVAVWGEEITITAASGAAGGSSGYSGGSGSGLSGGGAGGTSSRTVYYASSTYDTVTPYGGVELVVDTGSMQTLVIGDQKLGLTLYIGGKNGPEDSAPASFNAGFTGWNRGETETADAADEEDVDTLVLTAADAAQEDDGSDYCWTFDGSVYKKLAASGIDYLVFSTGEEVTALSTAGFTAGIRYNMLRAAGLASKAFVYSIRMGSGGAQVQVTVDGQTYTLTDDENREFYYYDLYTGTMDMLNMPFGQENDGNAASANEQD